MILHEAQSKIAKSKARFRVVNCGRRFGKTLLSCWEMFAFAVAKEDGRVAYIAPTYQQARDIAWNELKKICLPVMEGQPNESRLEIKVKNKFGGTSQISLRGWESVDTLRGQMFDFLVLDEISSYRNFWMNWQEVLRPTLTDRKGCGLFISTPKGFNHFYDLYNLHIQDTDYESFHFTTYDNPFVPTEEIDKSKKEITEDRFAQEYLADFRKTEGVVYKEFNRERHIIKGEFNNDDYNIIKTFGGVDFGFVHYAGVITLKKSGNGTYYISDEWYKTGKTDAQIADYVSALQWNECYPDPESAGGIEELNRRGVNVREVNKGRDSIRNGVNVVRELFKQGRLYVHESCINTVWELETYSYDEPKLSPRFDEIPKKENDHLMDALRYALMMESSVKEQEYAIRTRPDWISRKSNGILRPELPRDERIIQTRPIWIKRK